MTQINSIAQLNEMLQRRDFGAVLALTDTLLRKSQNNASAWHARARAAFGVGRLGLADECIDRSIALGEKAHDVLLLRAIIHHRLARSDLAIAGLRALMASNAPNTVDATLALAEVLHRADRRDELQALVLPRELAKAMQLEYFNGANKLKRAGTEWAFDKNLRAWSRLPVIAAILPGTVCFHVARDPRDMAISTFLSFFHPISDGWTSSMQSLRTVIEAERSILPQALSVLGIAHEQVVYEDLVADPAGHASRCLERLGLQMEPGVLSPERNARAVFTLSHAQVKQPINRGSIGRWKNYEFAFDDSWSALAAVHDARGTR